MKKVDLGQTLSILANVGVLAGLGLVAMELSQNTEQLRLELVWQVNDRMLQNNRDLLGENPAEVFAKFTETPESLTFAEFQIASSILFDFLSVWEDRYFLYQAGLASEAEWKSFIDDDLPWTLGSRFAQEWWQEAKAVFEPEVVRYVDQKLADVDTGATYRWYTDTMRRLSQ